MEEKKVVLVTGVAGYWGRRVVTQLLAKPSFRVLGVDATVPDNIPDGLDFIQADVRNPLLVELFKDEQVDTVCHLTFVEANIPTEATFDLNVMGTMKIFGACTQAGVGKIVLKSNTAVYGAYPDNPAFLTESHPLRGSRDYGYTRHMVEIEAFCNGFRRQAPEVMLTILRFANVLGPTADTPITRFLKGQFTPSLLGFDPMMQIIHEDDVVSALVHAIEHDVPGAFNIAAEGVMPLSRITALSSTWRIPILHPLAYWGASLLRETRLQLDHQLPIEPDYLRYRWVADTEKMHRELGFYPHYTAEEALREFAGHKRIARLETDASTRAFDEERLRDTLKRRRRARERQVARNGSSEEVKDHG